MYGKVVLKDCTADFDKEYIYSIPEQYPGRDLTGAKVIVPFGSGNKDTEGFIIGVEDDNDSPFFVKPLSKVEKPYPVILPDQIKLAAQMRKIYLCTYGDAIRLMVPAYTGAKEKTGKTVFLNDPVSAIEMINEGEVLHINQVRVIEYLIEYGEAFQSEIIQDCKITVSTLNTLKKKGIVSFGRKVSGESGETEEINSDDGKQPEKILEIPFTPNNQQGEAIQEVLTATPDIYSEFLLHGITGSGKTEVYMHIVKELLVRGKGAIFLVPEISLTPQMITRLKNRFGDDVRVLHSRLTPSQKFEQWKDILEGKSSVVVGARSAVFAPVKNLGIIIIDEEQETSYKSQTHPRYEAAHIARLRMRENKGILILGSATPKVETYHRAIKGKSTLLRITERANNAILPEVDIIDMRDELSSGNKSIFSRSLKEKMLRAFSKKEQVILFLNRRGYHGFFLCRDCGYVPQCESCSISLTHHSVNKSLICHYCGKMYHIPKVCPKCKSSRIGGFGAGTQKIEEICLSEFPGKKVLRMDQDTTTGRGSHEKILSEFEKGNADILIGTQMIAKGHDYANVTVVGILAADMILGMPDFRASERTFQLITQAAGRAGRSDKKGEVVIQAYNVDEYSILHSAKQDYEGFFAQEIAFRKIMNYPPFSTIGVIIVSSPSDSLSHEAAKKLHDELAECSKEGCVYPYDKSKVEVMDLSKAPINIIRKRFRYRIILKSETVQILVSHFARLKNIKLDKNVMVSFDINPFQMN